MNHYFFICWNRNPVKAWFFFCLSLQLGLSCCIYNWELDLFLFNPFTPRVKSLVNKCGSTFWVCGWNPSVWPFKWKLLSSTFKWCCLFLTILQNEIHDFLLSFELSTLGSERVNRNLSSDETSSTLTYFVFMSGIVWLYRMSCDWSIVWNRQPSTNHSPAKLSQVSLCR